MVTNLLLTGILGGILGFLLGATVGGGLCAWLSRKRQSSLETQLLELTRELATAQAHSKNIAEQNQLQKAQFEMFLQQARQQSQIEFENLAHRVLETHSHTLSERSEKNLDTLLRPLKDRISEFEKKVDFTYSTEAKERHALKSEVERLVQMNERMSQETSQLTQALKGDSKFQGDWGELVLEKILESSGLREGIEFTTQHEHRDSEGSRFRPDVIIHLPEQKHIIVDSKVSLKAYEQYSNTDSPQQKEAYLEAHLKSIQNHVLELSQKHYSKLEGLRSPEFVFLFIPIEPAYLLAMQKNPEISSNAWKKEVAIVTSTTLLTSLKTVASIWRLENQNRNAREIAEEGAKLYDKFVGFIDDFERIGKLFDSGHQLYLSALSKLKEGPGNVFRKMERLRELGAAPKNRIKSDYLE